MTVYLIHFSTPYKHARHYLGWTSGSVSARLDKHSNGKGSALMRAVISAGIEWEVVRVWEDGDHDLERRLHDQHNNPRLCPTCKATKIRRRLER